jgi:hypothetical protein
MGIEPERASPLVTSGRGTGLGTRLLSGLAAPMTLRSTSAADTCRMPQDRPGCQVPPRTGPPKAVPLLLRNSRTTVPRGGPASRGEARRVPPLSGAASGGLRAPEESPAKRSLDRGRPSRRLLAGLRAAFGPLRAGSAPALRQAVFATRACFFIPAPLVFRFRNDGRHGDAATCPVNGDEGQVSG